jgi:hypothetical protein
MLLYINPAQKIRNITMKYKFFTFFLLLTHMVLMTFSQSFAQDQEEVTPIVPPQELTLVRAVICEIIRGIEPLNEAVVFSIKRGEVYCFLDFDPVPEETRVRVSWFFKDERRRRVELPLKPAVPYSRLATYDPIQLRDADKGPWRVEVKDVEGNILKTLRFSIAD